MSELIFFFSYASEDADAYLEKFFDDLEAEVRRLAGRTGPASVGYRFQRDNDAGDNWPDELVMALATARILVAVYTPTYFGKAYCGREVGVFLDRCARYEREHQGQKPAAILPLIWVPLRAAVPSRLTDVHYADEKYGDTYAQEGLQYLKSLKRFDDDYRFFVRRFAKRVIEAGEAHELGELAPRPDIKTYPSAFDDPAPLKLPVSGGASPVITGPRLVNFVYGSGAGWTWAPYQPPKENQLGPVSFGIAIHCEFQPRELQLGDEFVQRLRVARDRNEIVVIFVDGSLLRDGAAARGEPYRQAMQQYDEQVSYANCAALVVWPGDLSETDRTQISRWVRQTFPNKRATSNAIYFQSEILSSAQLRKAIEETLLALQTEVLSRAQDLTVPAAHRMPALDPTSAGVARG